MNGCMLTVADTERFGDLVIQVISNEITERRFTETLRLFTAEIICYQLAEVCELSEPYQHFILR